MIWKFKPEDPEPVVTHDSLCPVVDGGNGPPCCCGILRSAREEGYRKGRAAVAERISSLQGWEEPLCGDRAFGMVEVIYKHTAEDAAKGRI